MRIFIVCMFLFGFIAGQDSMFVNLDTLIVGANSAENQDGQFVLQIEPKQMDYTKSLTGQLRREATIDTKTYGPAGKLSSISLRGMSSSHTVFNWNGFNINSLTLGSFDFGREAMPLNGGLSVNMSPVSSNYGSGTIGGVIAYQSGVKFNQGLIASYAYSAGINDYRHLKRDSLAPNENHHMVIEFSNKKYAIRSGFLYTNAPNHYVSDSNDLNTSEQFERLSAQLELYRKLKKGKFRIAYWGSISNNNLRPSATIPNQKDTNHRVVAKLHLNYTSSFIKAMIGYFDDASLYRSVYSDGTEAVYSFIGTTSLRSKFSWTKTFKKSDYFSATALFREDLANVENYGGSIRENQGNLILRYSKKWKKFLILPVLRLECYENYQGQGIKSISLVRKYKNWTFRYNVEDKFRIPTFNDRYWRNSGNPDLKPEKGWGTDLNASWFKEYKKSCLYLQSSIYWISLDNWIQWIPSENGLFIPTSYQKVVSRGATINIKYSKTIKKVQLDFDYKETFVNTRILENYTDNENLVGKQLVYSPKERRNLNLDVSYKTWKINLGGDYTSRRQTTSDNIDVWSLDPVLLFHGSLSYTKSFKKYTLTSFFNMENVLNKDFVWVRGYPMPGRFSQLGIKINFKSKQK